MTPAYAGGMTSLYRRWLAFQPTKVQAFWIVAAAVAVTLISGFGFAGWVSADKAAWMARQAADNARLELAVKVCVDEFVHDSGAKERLAKLNSAEFYRRSDIVATAGYATMPGEKAADTAVASQCAAALDGVALPAGKS
jgi:hypothetical protein